MSDKKRIVIFGGAGYLGSMLVHQLLDMNFQVDVFDSLRFGSASLEALNGHPDLCFIEEDIRNVHAVTDAVQGAYGVILLAALVGEPACDIDPRETAEINFLATKMVAETCRYFEVPRFIFASTDSVYGIREGIMREDSSKNPISLYAQLKLRAEEEILGLSNGNFSATVLRMATLYGCSPRMRFDLVVNILSLHATLNGRIRIFGGKQWRPFVHVADAAQAYGLVLNAPLDRVGGEIFNVGSNDQNYRVGELGNFVQQVFPEVEIETIPQDPDLRDYYVNCDKITDSLRFVPHMQIIDGIREVKDWIHSGRITDPHADWHYNVPRQ